jgi:hypothetical protein
LKPKLILLPLFLNFFAGFLYFREVVEALVVDIFIATGLKKVFSGKHSTLLRIMFIDNKKFKIHVTGRGNFLQLESNAVKTSSSIHEKYSL